ncbi:MAG: ABC transporter ATP-binding protein/permease [Eubacterium sp.]|nr:ABC transporter ATP-binding protein/permease [Eubacterium sp.]
MYYRILPEEEGRKTPVIKNILYAMKLAYKADKRYLIWRIIGETSAIIFNQFILGVLFLKVLLSVIEKNADFKDYLQTLFLFVIVALVNEIIAVYGDYTSLVGSKRTYKTINNMIFEKAANADISCFENPEFYDKYQRAALILTNGYLDMFLWDLSQCIGSFISLIFVVGVVTTIDYRYLIFLLPVILVFIIEIIKSKVVYKRDLSMTKNNRVKSYVQRTVFLKDFSKDMRTSNIFSVLMKRFDRAINDNIRILRSYGIKLFLFSMVSSFFSELLPIAGTYALAGYQFAVAGTLGISGFSVVLSSINSVRQSTLNMAWVFSDLSQMALYFQNLRDFFDYENTVISGKRVAGEFESIEFKNVSFRYPSAEKYSLKNVNLKINKGETIAIVGINGAGKTTFVKLLLRFYDVTDGEILYNGINIKEYNLESLRSRFATVFQDCKTFALSVNENVICRECDEQDKKAAEKALLQSGVFDKIQSLPNKADTVLTREFDDKGAGLSGGEAQKTAVARMFARDFDIAVLDEPSSALDPIAEYKMYENLIRATKNKTVVYISHRLSSAVLSDIIYVLGNGTVLETGSHNELMKAGGEYNKMFSLQASSYKSKEGYNA